MDRDAFAAAFEATFQAIYAAAVRRVDDGRDRLSAETITLLAHLAQAGPLTVGEMAEHFGRAASTMSVKVAHLCERGLLTRQDDGDDARRRYVWLTPLGRDSLVVERQVLDDVALARAAAALSADERQQLLGLLDRFVTGLRRDDASPPAVLPVARPPSTHQEERP